MFLVIGITGHVGGATARNLLAAGHKVRALVRDTQKAASWAGQGVELVQGDVNDAATLAGALAGVEGAYIMLPPKLTPEPDFADFRAIIANYVSALRQSPPPRLVVLSSVGSEKTSGLGLITSTHLLEDALDGERVPFPLAYIRAGSFYENMLPSVPVAQQTGNLFSFFQPLDRPVASIATADIGKLAADLLTGPSWTGRRVIELGTQYSPAQFAEAISAAIGKPVEAQAVPRDHWTPTLEQFGFPKGGTEKYEEMVDSVNSGWIAFGVEGTEKIAATVTPAEFFASHQG